MRLEKRAELFDPLRIADDDGVRVADRDRCQLDARDDLAPRHIHFAHRRLVLAVANAAHLDLALAHANPSDVGSGLHHQPRRSDAGAVP